MRQDQLTDPVPLDVMLERHRGRRGSAHLRAALDRQLDGGRRKKELEHRFRRFLLREGLPLPETNVQVQVPGDFITPDCVWRSQRLIVELDSRKYHLDPTAFERDRERDAALIAAGWRVIRVTWKRLHADLARLASQLWAVLAIA